jgi:PilZ domain
MHSMLSFIEQRRDSRHTIGRFVAPGTQAGAMEGFMVVDLSREGMSLLRVARKPGEGKPRGLDHRFSWLAIPLPEADLHLCALAEVVHRRAYGPLELLGVRFEQMSAEDRAVLDDYLSERERLSFGARKLAAQLGW